MDNNQTLAYCASMADKIIPPRYPVVCELDVDDCGAIHTVVTILAVNISPFSKYPDARGTLRVYREAKKEDILRGIREVYYCLVVHLCHVYDDVLYNPSIGFQVC